MTATNSFGLGSSEPSCHGFTFTTEITSIMKFNFFYYKHIILARMIGLILTTILSKNIEDPTKFKCLRTESSLDF